MSNALFFSTFALNGLVWLAIFLFAVWIVAHIAGSSFRETLRFVTGFDWLQQQWRDFRFTYRRLKPLTDHEMEQQRRARPLAGFAKAGPCSACQSSGKVRCASVQCRMDCVHCAGMQQRDCHACEGLGVILKAA